MLVRSCTSLFVHIKALPALKVPENCVSNCRGGSLHQSIFCVVISSRFLSHSCRKDVELEYLSFTSTEKKINSHCSTLTCHVFLLVWFHQCLQDSPGSVWLEFFLYLSSIWVYEPSNFDMNLFLSAPAYPDFQTRPCSKSKYDHRSVCFSSPWRNRCTGQEDCSHPVLWSRIDPIKVNQNDCKKK